MLAPQMKLSGLVLLNALFLSSAGATSPGASVEGHVALPRARPAPVTVKRYEIVTTNGVLATEPPLAVVYLEGDFAKPRPAVTKEVAQKDLAFLPPLLAIQVGTRVQFPNLDDTYHNIFSYSPAKRFDLGRYRPDERPVPSELFDRAGLVTLRCDIHEHMRGLILVVDTPHFVITNARRTVSHERTSRRPLLVKGVDRQQDDARADGGIKTRVDPARRFSMTLARRAGPEVVAFRRKLIVALMLVVSALTGLGLYLAQRATAASASRELQQSFQAEISALHKVHELRQAALAQRCAAMAQKPRIHAALEDNALDLLYPSAKEELRGLIERSEGTGSEKLDIEARFCRFLDSSGAVLPPPHPEEFGKLAPKTEASLNLKSLPESEQIGYLPDVDAGDHSVNEVTAVPIFSTETGKVISALVVGFAQPSARPDHAAGGIISGIWVGEQLYLPGLSKNDLDLLGRRIGNAIKTGLTTSSLIVHIGNASHLLFYKQLNSGSVFPAAYEVCAYPLTASAVRLRRLRWQIAGAGAGLLLAGFMGSHWIAMRLAKPVEQLAADSAKAEAALALTTEELERSSRYSADASHQLKSPVTLLRTGLESLLACEDLRPEIYEELAVLLHQTRRLTSVIDDLLLLSRVDAGRMEIKAGAVDLSQLIDEWLDDLEALPDSPDVTIERDIPAQLFVAGEKQYVSLIVQNLLENARKYNRAGGRISVTARAGDQVIFLRIGNTGRTIPSAAQSHVFERFYRAGPNGVGGGHGIG